MKYLKSDDPYTKVKHGQNLTMADLKKVGYNYNEKCIQDILAKHLEKYVTEVGRENKLEI